MQGPINPHSCMCELSHIDPYILFVPIYLIIQILTYSVKPLQHRYVISGIPISSHIQTPLHTLTLKVTYMRQHTHMHLNPAICIHAQIHTYLYTDRISLRFPLIFLHGVKNRQVKNSSHIYTHIIL